MNPHPYSPAYLAGGFGFVSGALSVDEDGRAVSGRLEAVEAATARLAERLQTVGLDLTHVVKTTYFVTDVSLREEANRHYELAYSDPRPARSFVEVAALPYGATVEIEAVAHQDPARSIPSGS
ncbi:RidA family protein [Kocuria sp. M1R5S2]|uniref:RidA family protein n=1 Tax=Kocuria rhizosphaerae TaxID=3376285 RepID=UPI0037AB9B41